MWLRTLGRTVAAISKYYFGSHRSSECLWLLSHEFALNEALEKIFKTWGEECQTQLVMLCLGVGEAGFFGGKISLFCSVIETVETVLELWLLFTVIEMDGQRTSPVFVTNCLLKLATFTLYSNRTTEK